MANRFALVVSIWASSQAVAASARRVSAAARPLSCCSVVAASAKTPERETSRADVSTGISSSKPSVAGSAGSQVGAGAESAIIQSLETTRVVGGDTLWRISRTRLGLGHRYTQIYAANAAQIRDPNLIYPDQVFVMPVK